MIGNPLRAFSIFSEFRDWELKRLEEMMTTKHLPAGTGFIRQGDLADAAEARAFVVLAGDVRILRTDERGGVLAEVVIGPGSILGVVALILDHQRTATCTTATDACVLEIDRAQFDAMFDSDNRIAVKFKHVIARQLAQHLRRANAAAARKVDK